MIFMSNKCYSVLSLKNSLHSHYITDYIRVKRREVKCLGVQVMGHAQSAIIADQQHRPRVT